MSGLVNKPVHAWAPLPFLPQGLRLLFWPRWGARGARFPCCPSRKLPLLLGYVYFPSEAGGWLDVFQRHCASQPVGWGAGLDSSFLLYLLPSGVGGQYQGERSGLSAGQSLASLASLSLGEEWGKPVRFPGTMGLPARSTNWSNPQTTNEETQPRNFRYV